jgi:hypothetical protein
MCSRFCIILTIRFSFDDSGCNYTHSNSLWKFEKQVQTHLIVLRNNSMVNEDKDKNGGVIITTITVCLRREIRTAV